uniref:TrmE_N domain-containing protein n=1 Tax=Steinernema glaseri TaxID=37863 RepID=A0A1I8A5R0_9BILA
MTARAFSTFSKTIFALSSGSPPSAIAVIRLSGSESIGCLKRLTKKSTFRPRELFYAPLYDSSDRLLDRSMAVYMPGPHTFTGEDTVEFYVHGGRAVVNAVMEAMKKMPNVDSAKAGEFTKRAFFNGKMDLSQVEALGDLISAETERQRTLALSQDNIARRLKPLREKLLHLMARFEAAIDFADDVAFDREEHNEAARKILEELEAMKESARKGERPEGLPHQGGRSRGPCWENERGQKQSYQQTSRERSSHSLQHLGDYSGQPGGARPAECRSCDRHRHRRNPGLRLRA